MMEVETIMRLNYSNIDDKGLIWAFRTLILLCLAHATHLQWIESNEDCAYLNVVQINTLQFFVTLSPQ